MDELNKRIIELIVRLELNKSTFGKELDVSLPLITHITSGRNKPGLDIIQKILLRFKQVDPDWLLLGSGQMYRMQPDKVDFTDIYRRIDKIWAEITEQESVNKTIKNYHKILIDEISHLREMMGIIEGSTNNLKNIKPELDKIRSQLESK